MSLSTDHHPIAALASGSGPGAVAIIRVSGNNIWPHVAPCLGQRPNDLPPPVREMKLYQLRNSTTSETIDEVMAAWFQGPRSFTGDDTLEIFCHGGPYITAEILRELYSRGVQPAQPGEFTKRALLNGKLDLTAAEGIKDLVEAQSRQQWLAGRQLYTGRLKNEIESLRTSIIGAMAYLEAMIDFPDEGDTANVELGHVRERVEGAQRRIEALVSTFQSGHVASQGLMVALAGPPNAGKSTLLNALLGKERAIVSEEAGTTRDYLEEKCLIDGRLVRLVDMAGIRETSDVVERAGVSRSLNLIKDADLVVLLMASDSSHEERATLEAMGITERPVLRLMTKSDLGRHPEWARDFLKVSCKSESGLGDFKDALAKLVDQHLGAISEQPFITSMRQQNGLLRASKAIKDFLVALPGSQSHELLAFELQQASKALVSIIGELSSEDILDKVFSDFCVGK